MPIQELTAGDGPKLHLRRWPCAGPAHGTVQIVHGLGEHIGRYEALAAALNAAGWHVVGHDLRGHGRSEGARGDCGPSQSLLSDLAAVIDHLHDAGGRHVLLGHSLGGAIAARFVAEALTSNARRWSREVDGLVLSSPALDPGLGRLRRLLLRGVVKLAPRLGLSNGLRPDWICRDPEVLRAYVGDPLVHRRVTPRMVRFILEAGELVRRRAPRWRTPTLLLWAGADRCVAPAGSAEFAAAAPADVVQSRAFPGLAHEIFNEPEREQVIATLLHWLRRFEAAAAPAP